MLFNALRTLHWVFSVPIMGYYFIWFLQQAAHLNAKTENAGLYGIVKILSPVLGISWIVVLVTGILRSVYYQGWGWPIIVATVATGIAALVGFSQMIPLGEKIKKISKEEIENQDPKGIVLFDRLKKLERINASCLLIGIVMMIVATVT